MANKKCCDQFNKAGGCPVHSEIKMVVQLKKEHKTMDSSPSFYNWVYQNRLPPYRIIQGMLERIEKYYAGKYHVIQFFKKGIDQPIFEKKAS